MAFSKCDARDNSSRWVQVEVEPELPQNWIKFICLKDNKPLTKLTKYEDPEGNKFKNLKSAVEAFGKSKALGKQAIEPALLKNNGKRKSLPLNVEELSPSKRQNMLDQPNFRIGENLAKSNVPFTSKQKSESVNMKPTSNNSGSNPAKQGLDKLMACSICNITGFSNGNEVLQHLKTEHLSCKTCNITYNTMPSLEVHMKEQHGFKDKKPVPVKTKFQCELCKQSYQTVEFLNKHKLQEHSKVPGQPEAVSDPILSKFSCSLCNLTFETKKLLKKHNKKLHPSNQPSSHSTVPLLPGIPSKPSLPPGPPLIPALQNGSNFNKLSQPVGYPTGILTTNRDNCSRIERSENVETLPKSINIFPCEECGDEFHSKKFLKKHMKTNHRESKEPRIRSVPLPYPGIGSVQDNININLMTASNIPEETLEENVFSNEVFEQTEELEFQDDYDLEQNIEVDQSLFEAEIPQVAINDEEEIDEYYDNEDFEEDVSELEVEDEKQKDYQNWQEDYDEELEQDEYYDLDENEHDDIEVISSGINKLSQISDDIEVVEDNSNRVSNQSIQKQSRFQKGPMHQSLNSIKSKYSQITITNNADISDDDNGSLDDEDYSDFSDEVDPGVPEEITLDDEPEEVTLDEDEDIVVLNNKTGTVEKEDMFMIENYETMVANVDFVNSLTENPEKLFTFKQNAWYAQPSSWKPTNLGEVWNATVPQICFHFKLHDYPLRPTWSFKNWEAFDEFITQLVERLNPGKPSSDLFKLKKAKWFLYLDPVIPVEQRVTVETLEGEEVGDEVDILTL